MKYTGRMREVQMLQKAEKELCEHYKEPAKELCKKIIEKGEDCVIDHIPLIYLLEELVQNENDDNDLDHLKSLYVVCGKDILNTLNHEQVLSAVQKILSSKFNPDCAVENYQELITKVANVEKKYGYDQVLLVTNRPSLPNSIELNLYEMWGEKSTLRYYSRRIYLIGNGKRDIRTIDRLIEVITFDYEEENQMCQYDKMLVVLDAQTVFYGSKSIEDMKYEFIMLLGALRNMCYDVVMI